VTRGPEEEVGRISSRRIYTGKVVSLDIDTVRFPNGSTGELEMIRHSGASAVVPFLDDPESDDPRILLIRQYRYAAEGYVYEIPAGRLDAGEAPAECAMRELREETGYKAGKLQPLTTFYTTPGFTDERIHLFLATELEAGETERESDEIMDLHPIKRSDVLKMVESGEIRDGKTMVGLLFVSAFTRQG
jgi:ADP-ribose pyrophosphatase